jgi:hypothetical protein
MQTDHIGEGRNHADCDAQVHGRRAIGDEAQTALVVVLVRRLEGDVVGELQINDDTMFGADLNAL